MILRHHNPEKEKPLNLRRVVGTESQVDTAAVRLERFIDELQRASYSLESDTRLVDSLAQAPERGSEQSYYSKFRRRPDLTLLMGHSARVTGDDEIFKFYRRGTWSINAHTLVYDDPTFPVTTSFTTAMAIAAECGPQAGNELLNMIRTHGYNDGIGSGRRLGGSVEYLFDNDRHVWEYNNNPPTTTPASALFQLYDLLAEARLGRADEARSWLARLKSNADYRDESTGEWKLWNNESNIEATCLELMIQVSGGRAQVQSLWHAFTRSEEYLAYQKRIVNNNRSHILTNDVMLFLTEEAIQNHQPLMADQPPLPDHKHL